MARVNSSPIRQTRNSIQKGVHSSADRNHERIPVRKLSFEALSRAEEDCSQRLCNRHNFRLLRRLAGFQGRRARGFGGKRLPEARIQTGGLAVGAADRLRHVEGVVSRQSGAFELNRRMRDIEFPLEDVSNPSENFFAIFHVHVGNADVAGERV